MARACKADALSIAARKLKDSRILIASIAALEGEVFVPLMCIAYKWDEDEKSAVEFANAVEEALLSAGVHPRYAFTGVGMFVPFLRMRPEDTVTLQVAGADVNKVVEMFEAETVQMLRKTKD